MTSLNDKIALESAKQDDAQQAQADTTQDQSKLLQDMSTEMAVVADLENQLAALSKEVEKSANIQMQGTGEQNYITGMKIEGPEIGLLIDKSASMMGDNLVDILGKLALSDSQKVSTPKWIRTKRVAQWMLARVPLESRVTVVTFSDTATTLGLRDVNSAKVSGSMNAIVKDLGAVVPNGGTNLQEGLSILFKANPNITDVYIVTDGLPTLGDGLPMSCKSFISSKKSISSDCRKTLFVETVKRAKKGVHYSVILLPIEGRSFCFTYVLGMDPRNKRHFPITCSGVALMRKIQRAPVEVFNIAFLDIISCAFGAVVMLVLLAKNGTEDTERGPSNVSVLIDQVLQAQVDVETLKGALSDKLQELKAAQSKTASVTEQKDNLDSSIPRAQQTINQLKDKASSLRNEIRQATAMLNTPNPTDTPDDDVGGIPTDAEYVIFAIDNSGSMSSGSGWNRVITVVNDILKNHPKMKGFQIMSADGSFMFSSRAGQWLDDRQTMRDTAMSQMKSFKGGASQPEAGILKAIKLYKNTKGRVSLYVFGDDYQRPNLDQIVSQITQANQGANGQPVIRIHGVGFSRSNGNAQRFSAFMQAVAKRNRGAFIGQYF